MFNLIEQFVLDILILVMALKHKRIRDLREDHDYTQEEVGKQINIPQRTYAYYESGERMVPPHVLSALADFYHVSVDYILERTNNPEMNRYLKIQNKTPRLVPSCLIRMLRAEEGNQA